MLCIGDANATGFHSNLEKDFVTNISWDRFCCIGGCPTIRQSQKSTEWTESRPPRGRPVSRMSTSKPRRLADPLELKRWNDPTGGHMFCRRFDRKKPENRKGCHRA